MFRSGGRPRKGKEAEKNETNVYKTFNKEPQDAFFNISRKEESWDGRVRYVMLPIDSPCSILPDLFSGHETYLVFVNDLFKQRGRILANSFRSILRR